MVDSGQASEQNNSTQNSTGLSYVSQVCMAERYLKSSGLGETGESVFSRHSPDMFTGNRQENKITD